MFEKKQIINYWNKKGPDGTEWILTIHIANQNSLGLGLVRVVVFWIKSPYTWHALSKVKEHLPFNLTANKYAGDYQSSAMQSIKKDFSL